MKRLLVKNLTIKYLYGAEAISRLSFECKKGENATVFAQNEGGKTSLLKAIAGLVKVTEGEVVLNGRDITNAKCKHRNCLVIYNEWGLSSNYSVKKNLLHPLKVRKYDANEAIEIVTELIAKFNLTAFANKKVKLLDNYQKIAVVFARAMVRKADLYLIDNIFTHIEESDRNRVFMDFLPVINELSNKAPLIFATDSQFEAQVLGQNLIVLNYGIVLQKGSFQSIKESPLSLFVFKMLYGDKLIVEDAVISKYNDKIFIEINEKAIYLDKDKLINDIFIGKTVMIAYINHENNSELRIFDKRSEQLIYFG